MRSQSSAPFSRLQSLRRRQCHNQRSALAVSISPLTTSLRSSPLSYLVDPRRFSSQNSINPKYRVETGVDLDIESRWNAKRSNLKEDGLTLSHFIASSAQEITSTANVPSSTHISVAVDLGDEFYDEKDLLVTDSMSSSNRNEALDRLGHQIINATEDSHDEVQPHTLKFHIKTYGCQMNVNDTDIVRSILINNHIARDDAIIGGPTSKPVAKSQIRFIETYDEIQADVLLTNTCAIRENAEQKVWNRLRALRAHDRNFPLTSLKGITSNDNNDIIKSFKEQRRQRLPKQPHNGKKRIIGVLGCMAERLKEDMFKDGTVDIVVGPDALKDLPRLIYILTAPSSITPSVNTTGANTLPTERAVNVQLSLEETYASIAPIRSNPNDVSAFVSIMRGCNNMCSYCVVPFTRGRERSREMESVVEETKRLLNDEGIKEVILLGQNVNSYHDVRGERVRGNNVVTDSDSSSTYQTSNDGFSNIFRLRHGDGYRFADLLAAVSDLSPELRIRFTSPHPKDYPPPLLSLMAERGNICKHLHMPAQSGSSSVLERMRRGYTREAYLELINDVKGMIPEVAISSDFITGFCGETEEEHMETLSLMQTVQYDQAFMFAYSMREKTHAHRTMFDDIPPDVKNRRLNEIISCFRRNVQLRNEKMEIGKLRLVLVEGEAKSSTAENRMWSGRTDQNKRVVFASEACFVEEEVANLLSSVNLCSGNSVLESLLFDDVVNQGLLKRKVGLSRGDFAVVRISEVRGHTLKGHSLWRGSMQGFEELMNMKGFQECPPYLGKSMSSEGTSLPQCY